MPRSSVFVRLNWPSKSDDSSFEGEGSPQLQGSLPSPSSSGHVEKTPSSDSGDSLEKNPLDHEANIFSSCIPATACVKEEKYVESATGAKSKSRSNAKHTVERGTEPLNWSQSIQPSSSSTVAGPPPSYDDSCIFDKTPTWGVASLPLQKEECPHASVLENVFLSPSNSFGCSRRGGSGSLKYNKPRTKPKPRNLTSKGRRITRSLSASCVSVSTNTDPRDFVELAKVSATLPIRRRVKDTNGSSSLQRENKAVSCSLDNDGMFPAEECSIAKSEMEGPEENIHKNVVHPPMQLPQKGFVEDKTGQGSNVCDYNFEVYDPSAVRMTCTTLEEPAMIISERCAGDGCDDNDRGYIELPTYLPSTINLQPKATAGASTPCTVLPDEKNPVVSCLANTLEKLNVMDAPYIDDEIVSVLESPQDIVKPRVALQEGEQDFPNPDLTRRDFYPSASSSEILVPSPISAVHHCDLVQDKLDIVPVPSRCQGDGDLLYFGEGYEKHEGNLYKKLSNSEERELNPVHWSPVPKHHQLLLQAAARRQLEKDISLESCPDVVLQTLDCEGGGCLPSKTNKKSVTFLLPPEHWDSLISLRENNIGGYPQSGYAELDSALLPPNGQDPYRNTPSPGLHGVPQDRYVRWRDPDLHEVIDFLSNPNNVVKANAAAYLQHLCYMDDPTKQKTRILGGIPPLVALLSHDLPELHRNACGALRNLSYGRQNDENKRAIKDASGIPSLVRLLRKTPDNEIKELVTGILWNLSSCEDLKHSIIDDALTVTVSHVIIPCSGWDGGEVERDPNVDVWWSTVFKNASGVLRNVSSAGEYARTKLRQCIGLVDSLLTVIKSAIAGASHDNKSVENCVCILRNLSYRCQEVEDPNYDKNQPPTQSRATATTKGDNLGCFGGSRKKKEAVGGAMKETSTGQRSSGPRTEPLRGMELLWQPEVVVGPYLALLSDCSNPETLEAAAGALQNLAACYWQPSIDVRASVRKEKGLPILVELLRMEVDRVVCAVATALRNLAIDQRNKELIGKYAMRELVQKLPSGNTHDTGTSDETIAAVLATLNEVIKKNAEFSRSLLDFGGVERLVNMTRLRGRYSVRVVKFASQVLFSMWGHQELREVYKKAGWKEQDFVSKSVAARNAAGGGANSPTANNTLNRPMASQGGTRYEDRTIQRGQGKAHQQREQLPMSDMGYGGDGGIVPPAGGVRLYPPVQGKPGEPVYAKVNRDKKRNRQYDGVGPQYGTLGADDWGGPVYSGSPAATPNFNNSPHNNNNNNTNNNGVVLESGEGQAGDSWV